ncbi:hypothetical protein QYE76_046344 [Lolium multiflorum]|uniref:Transposase (putative) gypsy type domain-containing protein n=1 Tax=Lolium multiflorum TaxID=4521 RepID=A0AAD8TPT0_LOLMU|nr:hypothetical protein QYE76_046344 [Lolium multiflorum]
MTKAWVERGLSLPCSEFFLSVLDTYGLQPHNICANSYLLLSNFATLCEGHLGIRPDVKLWQFFFRVKKETKDKAMLNCGSMTFMLRSGRMYPPHDSHESVRYWNTGASGEASAKKPKVTKPPPLDSKKAERERLKMLSTAGRPSRPNIPGAANPNPTTARTNVQEHITKYMHKKSPAIGPSTPAPPSAPQASPQPSPPPADQSPSPAASTPPEIIPVSSGRAGGDGSGGKGPVRDETEGQSREEAEVNSSGKAEATAGDMVVFPKNFGDPADLTSTPKAYATKFFNKLSEAEKWELEQDLLNAMLNNAWGKPDVETLEIQDFKKDVGHFLDKLVCKQKEQKALHYELHKNIALQRRVTISQAEKIQRVQTENADLKKKLSEAQGASSSLAAASSELETLRASQKNLEAKLAEAEQKLAEKNSELTRKAGEFELKRKTDTDTIQKQQKEFGGLRKYMETAESCWDLLNSDVKDPLGYDEERRSQFPRDDLLQLAGEDCKDLISASRKICRNLNIKKSRTCHVHKLIKRMDLLPELVVDLQSSSARGAAAMSLAMCLAHNPKMNLDRVTAGVPPDADVNALLDAVSGYDMRIARRIRHDEFYEKAVLPADEPLEAELLKEREAETRPAQSGSQYTWTSSKDKGGATSPTAAEEEEDEDVSSPAKDAEKESPTDA